MADEGAPPPLEGWHVPQRTGFVAAVATPVVLGLAVFAAGHAYNRTLRPLHRVATTTFPAPGIETFIHDGQADPKRPSIHPRPDASIDAAKRAVAARGLGDWRPAP